MAARVRLASWWDGHAPGDVVEVPDEQVGPLRRDGRVATVLEETPAPPAPAKSVARPAADEPAAEPEGQADGQPAADGPKRRRKPTP